jgi:predicted nucleic-acid-binding protein
VDGIETSVLVRYLVQDDPEQGAAAARLVDSDAVMEVSLVALAETAFVLAHHYRVPRDQIVDALVKLVRKRNIRLFGVDKDLVASALLRCGGSGRVSFADALIYAEARAHQLTSLYSFDRRFPADALTVKGPQP